MLFFSLRHSSMCWLLKPKVTAFHQVEEVLPAPASEKTTRSRSKRAEAKSAHHCANPGVEGIGEPVSGSAPSLYKWANWSLRKSRKQNLVLFLLTVPPLPPLPAPSKSLDLHEVIVLWSVPRRGCSDRDAEGCVVNSLLVLEQLRMPDILEGPPQIWFHFHEFNETLFSFSTQVMP